jgi:hypothetical protein
MSDEQGKTLTRSREAWAAVGEEFADIARRFRDDYDRVGDTVAAGTETSQKSLDRAVHAVREAVAGTARAISDALRDPKVKEETEEAGSALLRAVGVTLSDLGESLQRDAEREKTQAV